MSPLRERLQQNLRDVWDEIACACENVGRSPHEVTLVAVTKTAPLDWIPELFKLGQLDLAENRPQQLVERYERLPEANWHLIGHLQRNKVRQVLPRVVLIHSVDSWRLLDRIDQVARELGLTPSVLLEVNVSGEESKDGFEAGTLLSDWSRQPVREAVKVTGLMTMAPWYDDPEQTRPVFRRLSRLRDELRELVGDPALLPHLSMGMSNDFRVAVEEGATLVRVGSRLFEGLPPQENSGAV